MTMGERLRQLRREKGLTQEELGKYIGVKKAAIMKYEKGNVQNMKRSSIEILSKLFNVTPSYLMCLDDNKYSNNLELTAHTPLNKGKTRKIPVVGKVAAGFDVNAIVDVIGWEEIDETFPEGYNYFGLVIQGDSMEPRIKAGDVVIVRSQPDIENGEYAIVRVDGENATIKRISKDINGITLIPLNNSYLPKFYSNEDIIKIPVEIIGKVVELRAKF